MIRENLLSAILNRKRPLGFEPGLLGQNACVNLNAHCDLKVNVRLEVVLAQVVER